MFKVQGREMVVSARAGFRLILLLLATQIARNGAADETFVGETLDGVPDGWGIEARLDPPFPGAGDVRTSVSFLEERVVCERNRDHSRTATPAGGLSL